MITESLPDSTPRTDGCAKSIDECSLRAILGKRVARFALEEAGTYFIAESGDNHVDFIAAESLRSLDEIMPRSDDYHALVRLVNGGATIPYMNTAFAGGSFHSTDDQLAQQLKDELLQHGKFLRIPPVIQRRKQRVLPQQANRERYTLDEHGQIRTFPLREIEWESLEAALHWSKREGQYAQMIRSPLDYSCWLTVSKTSPREQRNNGSFRIRSPAEHQRMQYVGSLRWNCDGKPFIPLAGNTDARFAEYMRDTVPGLTRYDSRLANSVLPRSVQLPIPKKLYKRQD